jgi:CheY-like chemotaxis protein
MHTGIDAIIGGKMGGMKILCVENQPEDLATLTCMLEGIGYEVMSATNGGQAIELLSRQTIDGVLLDYDLPDASGAAVRARLKAIRPDIPVLLFAGVGSQTPFMLRFFDAYLRNAERFADTLGDLEV